MAKEKFDKNIQIRNRRASFDYHFIDTYIAGLCLTGTEIKSIRLGNANLTDSYCVFHEHELVLKNLQISPYAYGNVYNHDPKRDRTLLLKKTELRKLKEKSEEKGLTIAVSRIFINDRGFAKIEIALAKGKKMYDKREDIKKRDIEREMRFE
ncbi:MAG: SsrA-binding protein SmpB [Cytophagaceae bacterium]|nr:SsrA-binding protein SmpB [Cytophagaceae bacterium]